MLVIGHRGAAGLKPENTLASWRLAIELGVDFVECDVRMSKDGYAVIMHDATVDRTTNGEGAIAHMMLREIRSLDAGEGQQVPLLSEFLDLVASTGVKALVEIKCRAALQPAIEEIANHRLYGQAILTGPLEWMAEAKRGNAAMEVGIPARTLTPEQLQEIARMGAQGVGIHFTCLTEELVRLCHRLGLAVRGWNPVTKQDIAYTIGFGVDGVTTDRPDIALELLGRLPGMPQ